MTKTVPDPPVSEVVAWAVEAYESAVASDCDVDAAAFVPLPGYPHRSEVVAELIRVEMELSWRRGAPKPLAGYLRQFPSILDEPQTLCSVAFEEYRQRRLGGELADPAEYARTYGIDVTLWPPVLPRRY